MTRRGCGWWAEVGRTVKPRRDPRLRAHLARCEECDRGIGLVERAASALAALPHPPPGGDHREQARTRLIAAVAAGPRPRAILRPLWARVAVVLGASLGGATVLAAVGTHLLESWHPPAVVETASPPRPPRPRPRAAVVPPPVAPAPSAPPVPGPGRRVRPHRAPRPPVQLSLAAAPPVQPIATPAERAFDEGWDALRSGDHLHAAAQMQRAVMLGGGGSVDEDARYWRAVALGRAGVATEARQAMEQFLQHHPQSGRAGEVCAMLGWLLVDAGQADRARELFVTASRDRSARVVESARAGLRLLDNTPR